MQDLKRKAQDIGVADCVTFHGALAHEDVLEVLADSHLFVFPTRVREGFPKAVIEAMACGLPVVATRVGGNGELVLEGETGFLVPRADSQALAAALLNYVENDALRAAHGTAARTRVEGAFSIDRMIGRYLEVYDELCHQQDNTRYPAQQG